MTTPTEPLWTVDAPVMEHPPDPPIACHSVLLSYPPQPGAGVRVGGLDPRTVPDSRRYPNGTIETPTLRLTGTYSDGWLTLVEPPTAVPARPLPATRPPHATACPDPGNGDCTEEQQEAVFAYAEAQPDSGAAWYSEQMRVVNVSFTGDLERHRHAIRSFYPGPLCVVAAPIRTRELREIQQRLHADAELTNHGIEILGSGPEWNAVSLLVVAATLEQIDFVRQRYDTHVEVTSWLLPVPFISRDGG